MNFKDSYQNVLTSAWKVNAEQIDALINEFNLISYQLYCTTDFQVSVESLDCELVVLYKEDMAIQANKQPSLLSNLIFPLLAVQVDQCKQVTLSNLFSARVRSFYTTPTQILVNYYIPRLFDTNATKIKNYTPLRKHLFFVALRLLIEFNSSQHNALDELGYSWDEIHKITTVSRDGIALLKLYYEQRLFGDVSLKKIPKDLIKSINKSNDQVIKLLWKQIKHHGTSQLATFGKEERRVPKLKYALIILLAFLWLMMIGVLGREFMIFFELNQILQTENQALLMAGENLK